MSLDTHPAFHFDPGTQAVTVDPPPPVEPVVVEPPAPVVEPPVVVPPAPVAPTTPAEPELVGKYRLDEVLKREQEVREDLERQRAANAELIKLMGSLRTPPTPAAPAAPPDPEQEEIRAEFFQRFPEMKRVVEWFDKFMPNMPILEHVLQSYPEREKAEQARQQAEAEAEKVRIAKADAFVDETLTATYAEIAQRTFGKVQDLAGPVREGITRILFTHLNENPALKEAFNNGRKDEVVKAFADYYEQQMIVPVRQPALAQASAAQRAAATAKLPRQGPGTPPAPTPPPTPDNADEEAVHKRGWAVAQSIRSAG